MSAARAAVAGFLVSPLVAALPIPALLDGSFNHYFELGPVASRSALRLRRGGSPGDSRLLAAAEPIRLHKDQSCWCRRRGGNRSGDSSVEVLGRSTVCRRDRYLRRDRRTGFLVYNPAQPRSPLAWGGKGRYRAPLTALDHPRLVRKSGPAEDHIHVVALGATHLGG